MDPCARLSYASDSGATRICHREVKASGSEATSGGGGGVHGRGVSRSSHGREILANSCMKTTFSRTLKAIIRGSLNVVAYRLIPSSFPFSFEFVSDFHFLLLFFSFCLSVFLLFFRFLFPLFFSPFFSLFPPSFSPFFAWSPVRQGGTLPPPPPLA